jgi:hypothetical protein
MDKQKYYVITAIDVEHLDADNDWLYISTKPAYGNMDKEPVIEGWAGTTNGIAVYGHGEFDSVEDAIDYIMADFDLCEHRTGDENGEYDSFNQDPDIIHTFKLGLLHVMDEYETDDYMWEWLKDITGNESDSDLDKIWDRAQENAKENGCLFSGKGLDMLYGRRDAVRHEREG